ncbi:MAG: DUF1194 domain-containing protein [Amaricoccus sp.]
MVRAAALVAALLAAGPAGAQDCRLALALAIDVSSSVDAEDYRLQSDGIAAALLAPEVQAAFLAGPGSVALAIYEWSGQRQQALLQDWVMIEGPDDLARVAAALAGRVRSTDQYPTALGMAIEYGARLLRRGPRCDQDKLDISGDGTNNDGIGPTAAARDASITINGLPIVRFRRTLERYYSEFVIRGPGAFVETADGYEDFARAMRRKLLREVEPAVVSALEPDRGSRRAW